MGSVGEKSTSSLALITSLSQKTTLSVPIVSAILQLLDEGSTIPFIARYRKEMTGNASDEQLRLFDELCSYEKKLLTRKEEVSRLIEERGYMTSELSHALNEVNTLQQVEDLYRPFKEKKNSRAASAITHGLEPLANFLTKAHCSQEILEKEAKKYLSSTIETLIDALQGAKDILAERYSDEAKEREFWRKQLVQTGVFEIKGAKGLNPQGLYAKLADKSERIATIPSHRYLALMRGVAEKELSIKIPIDMNRVEEILRRYRLPAKSASSDELLLEAYVEGFKRLLFPSLEREIHAEVKERADSRAIMTFGKNLTQLLNTPPVTKRFILGVDPAFRTGCKLAVLDEQGTFITHRVIYPTPPQSDYKEAAKTLKELLTSYPITTVAIGNGTASRETQEFFATFNKNEGYNLGYTVVSEAGASVYSASKLACEEYPHLDVTIRGAISIAARLADPMAALVKIDPKSLGVGQYQHDVNQKLLEKKLHEVTEDLVNRIGVDPNTASATLLSYVAGIGEKLAKAIVEHRQKNGPFRTKSDLKAVKGLGVKAYEQSAGFFRIRESVTILDKTGIHPESYAIASYLLKNYDIFALTFDELLPIAKELNVGLPTLNDILHELKKPGFDPREELPPIVFRLDVVTLDDLYEGAIVAGVVRNLTDFGAFIDIGLKNDALLHISQMSEKRIAHPLEVLALNQQLSTLKVLEIDKERGKVSVSLRT